MYTALLKDKKILLGVTASISIYKSLELIRLFIKSGAEVRVVMSESAKKFITPLTFETISMNRVLHIDSESWHDDLNHIKIGQWADIFVLAPTSANTIAKLSQGIADNLLLQTALAYADKKILAPAANTHMIQNFAIQEAMTSLRKQNYEILGTQSKLLACNTEGDGALIDIEEIYFATAKALLSEKFYESKEIVITGGGTIERIDDVRFISNFSSGKMASNLALALYLKGANVTLISTKFPMRLPQTINKISVESSNDMFTQMQTALSSAKKISHTKPFLFMAAAVSDYTPATTNKAKMKKENIGSKWNLALHENVDLLKNIDKKGIITIGFKAEMDALNGLESAKKMLEKKNLDGVCYNLLSEENNFGSDENEITFITSAKQTNLSKSDKLTLSLQILEVCKEL